MSRKRLHLVPDMDRQKTLLRLVNLHRKVNGLEPLTCFLQVEYQLEEKIDRAKCEELIKKLEVSAQAISPDQLPD